jgi:hypothetical protein
MLTYGIKASIIMPSRGASQGDVMLGLLQDRWRLLSLVPPSLGEEVDQLIRGSFPPPFIRAFVVEWDFLL